MENRHREKGMVEIDRGPQKEVDGERQRIIPPVIREPATTTEEGHCVTVAGRKIKAKMPPPDELIIINLRQRS